MVSHVVLLSFGNTSKISLFFFSFIYAESYREFSIVGFSFFTGFNLLHPLRRFVDYVSCQRAK